MHFQQFVRSVCGTHNEDAPNGTYKTKPDCIGFANQATTDGCMHALAHKSLSHTRSYIEMHTQTDGGIYPLMYESDVRGRLVCWLLARSSVRSFVVGWINEYSESIRDLLWLHFQQQQ